MDSLGDSTSVSALEQRLKSAEEVLKSLNTEIEDIKQKISVIKNANVSSKKKSHEYVTTAAATYNFKPGTSLPVSSKRCADENDVCDNSNTNKHIKLDLIMDGDHVEVYTDGACENNGQSGAKAGIGVWFADNHPLNVSEPVTGRATNNTAEIQACIAAAKIAFDNGFTKLKILTDSEFVIKCMTQWIKKWKVNGWKVASGNDVKNKKDLMKLDKALSLLESVRWEHVRGHKGVKGNEAADQLARDGARRYTD